MLGLYSFLLVQERTKEHTPIKSLFCPLLSFS
nr:MAG TPA: hypothetical protein [Caudoviricetes sp.]